MIKDIQNEILRLKKENNICILAHSYQAEEILEIADYTGDSFQLSLMAQKAQADTVIMCGVRFMAETVKILSPQKKVFLANPIAGCPMAEQMDKELISKVKNSIPIMRLWLISIQPLTLRLCVMSALHPLPLLKL